MEIDAEVGLQIVLQSRIDADMSCRITLWPFPNGGPQIILHSRVDADMSCGITLAGLSQVGAADYFAKQN